MNLSLVIYYYFFAAVGAVIWCAVLIKIFHGKFFTKTAPRGTLRGKEKIAIRMSNTFLAFTFVLLTMGVVVLGVPAVLDLPYVLQGNYAYVSGTVIKVISHSKDSTITIRDKYSEKEVDIYYVFSTYEKGDMVDAYYLPHLKIGTIEENVGDE